MYSVDIYSRVRRACLKDGMSARAAALYFNKDRKTIAKLLAFFENLPPCVVGIEACGSSHHWARTLRKLGHDVRLMPANYVKPYVKRGKTDAVDAEAIAKRPDGKQCGLSKSKQRTSKPFSRSIAPAISPSGSVRRWPT
jgi:transposase